MQSISKLGPDEAGYHWTPRIIGCKQQHTVNMRRNGSIVKVFFHRCGHKHLLLSLVIFIVSVLLFSLCYSSVQPRENVRVLRPKSWSGMDQKTWERCHTGGSSADDISRWNEYRIGDIVALRSDAPGCELYPKSIGCEYTRETEEPNDIAALKRVLDNHSQQLGYNLAALHVRIGDGLCAQIDDSCRGMTRTKPDCWNDDRDCFTNIHSNTKQYAYSRRWYETVVSELKTTRVSRIVIVGDKYHWTRTPDPRNGNYRVDEEYLGNVAHFFRTRGFEVCVKDTEVPDVDFALLCSARVFIQGGGGYSALVAEIVKQRGGLVIRPTNSSEKFSAKTRY